MTKSSMKGRRMSFINRIKVVALNNSNGITNHSYKPWWILKLFSIDHLYEFTLCDSRSSNQILWKQHVLIDPVTHLYDVNDTYSYGDFFECPIVDAHAPPSIILLYQDYWWPTRKTGLFNNSCLQQICYLLLDFFILHH